MKHTNFFKKLFLILAISSGVCNAMDEYKSDAVSTAEAHDTECNERDFLAKQRQLVQALASPNSLETLKNILRERPRYAGELLVDSFIFDTPRNEEGNKYHEKPLRIAIHQSHKDALSAIKILIDRGANIHAVGGFEAMNSLTLAVWRGKAEAVKLLIHSGALVNKKHYAYTHLMVACISKICSQDAKRDVAFSLIEAGADLDSVQDEEGKTGRMYLQEAGLEEIIDPAMRSHFVQQQAKKSVGARDKNNKNIFMALRQREIGPRRRK